jgi:hypothetical protein
VPSCTSVAACDRTSCSVDGGSCGGSISAWLIRRCIGAKVTAIGAAIAERGGASRVAGHLAASLSWNGSWNENVATGGDSGDR